jgi:hypothetical protein
MLSSRHPPAENEDDFGPVTTKFSNTNPHGLILPENFDHGG